jgi:hypothetical protein
LTDYLNVISFISRAPTIRGVQTPAVTFMERNFETEGGSSTWNLDPNRALSAAFRRESMDPMEFDGPAIGGRHHVDRFFSIAAAAAVCLSVAAVMLQANQGDILSG